MRGFISALFILGFLYVGTGFVVCNVGSENWKAWASDKFGVLGWPKLVVAMANNSSEYDEYCSTSRRSRSDAAYDGGGSGSSYHGSVARSAGSGGSSSEAVVEQAERSVQQMGDAFLGEGRSARIMDIAKQSGEGGLSPEQAASRIVDEVPTGLPKPVDAAVKGWSKRLAGIGD